MDKGAYTHSPVAALQASRVQGLLSEGHLGVPLQTPLTHWSFSVHLFLLEGGWGGFGSGVWGVLDA